MNERTSMPQTPPAPPPRPPVRVLAIADTDSYLKWSAATLEALPDFWESTQLLIENPVMPSLAQIRAASKRPVEEPQARRAGTPDSH